MSRNLKIQFVDTEKGPFAEIEVCYETPDTPRTISTTVGSRLGTKRDAMVLVRILEACLSG
jgi:hypothetical protein